MHIFVEIKTEKDMTTDIATQVKNYNGNNSFIIKMKDSISRYGSLTPKQRTAVEKIFSNLAEIKSVELTGDLKVISDYQGSNSFVNDIKSKLAQFGKLSDKQVSAAMKQIDKENNKPVVRKMNFKAEGDTIKVGRGIGQGLKEKYNLNFNPILLDITKVMGVTAKAVKFSGKMTVKRGDVCVCCAKTLTDEFSMLTKMGKTCAKHMGVEYITDKSQADKFREDYLKKVEEIGEMEFWVPRNQIKLWDGKGGFILDMSEKWF
jgi:hypothetical protein